MGGLKKMWTPFARMPPLLLLAFAACIIAAFLFGNELYATSTGKPHAVTQEAAESMVIKAIRQRPPASAAPKEVAIHNEVRSSDGLLLWLKAAYPDIDANCSEWRTAALAFIETRDPRIEVQTRIVQIMARALSTDE